MALPENYTRLLYIESNGTQYINTGVIPNRNTRIVLDVEGFGTKVEYLYGVDEYKKDFCLVKTSATSTKVYGYYFGGAASITVSNTTDRLIYEQNGNVFSIGTATATANASSSYTECSYPLYLFNIYSADKKGISNYGASVKLYSCRIYDNGSLVRDFIPCENESGTTGLYDLVNNTFYPDASGAGFVAGALPDYKVIDANVLDGALTATADAIREKTGETAQIAWDASSGFASTISGISSGARVATGTFTAYHGATYYDLTAYPLTVSGLGFRPSRVFAYSAGGNGNAASPTLAIFDVGDESVFLDLGSRKLTTGTNYTVSLNADGFTLSAVDPDGIAYIMYNTWNYIAIG